MTRRGWGVLAAGTVAAVAAMVWWMRPAPAPEEVRAESADAAPRARATAESALRVIAGRVTATDALELRLEGCSLRITGTVRDASGGFIEGASVERADARWIAATTSRDGRFELCLPAGDATEIVVRADGYGAVLLAPGDAFPVPPQDVVLVPEGGVAGRVVRAADGAPVEGATIAVATVSSELRAAPGAGESDAEGKFHVAALAPGTFEVAARKRGFVVARTEVVVNAAAVTEVVLELEAGARVAGKVLVDGQPAAGVPLAVVAADRRQEQTISGDGGAFEVDGLRAGTYAVESPGHDVLRPEHVVVEAPETTGVVVELRARATGIVRGRVLRGGRPVAGAVVERGNERLQGRAPPERRSGADGRYELRGLSEGAHVLHALDAASGGWSDGVTVRLARGELREGVDLELAYSAAVDGIVVDQDGRAVVGATVRLVLDDVVDQGSATTGEDGRFSVRFLSGGGIYVASVAAGAAFEPARSIARVNVPGRDSHVRDLRLVLRRNALTIDGKVVDGAGAPVADATVVAQLMELARPPGAGDDPVRAITRVDGAFLLEGLGRREYALHARTAAGGQARLVGVAGGARDVVLVLGTPGRIVGKLVNFGMSPMVRVSSTSGLAVADGSVNDTSSFEVHGLAPGRYWVSAQNHREGAVETVDVPAGGAAEVTLTNRGGVLLRGRVVDLATRAPLPRFRCSMSPRAGDIILSTWLRVSDITDESGTFEIPKAPSGDIGVICWPEDRGGYSSAALGLTVDATRVLPEIELAAVKAPAGPRGLVGIRLWHGGLAARVDSVMSSSPAARAGLAPGDVVVAVDGVDTSRLSSSGVANLMNGHAPGTRVTVTVRRGAEMKTVTMTTEAELDHQKALGLNPPAPGVARP